MLHDAQRTSAPSACIVSISTAGLIVMGRLRAMRAPRSGRVGANSSRIAMRPGISVSAMAISLRPQSASARSATAKSAKLLVSVLAFIGHSIVVVTATGGTHCALVTPCADTDQRARFEHSNPEPGSRSVAGGCCNAPREGGFYLKPRAVWMDQRFAQCGATGGPGTSSSVPIAPRAMSERRVVIGTYSPCAQRSSKAAYHGESRLPDW